MKIILTNIIALGILLAPGYAIAAGVDPLADVCNKQPDASVCKDKAEVDPNDPSKNPLYGPDGIITKIVNLVSILTGIAAVIVIIVAGLKFIVSGSNSQEVTKAREWAIYALVGLIIAALAQVLVRLILFKTGVV